MSSVSLENPELHSELHQSLHEVFGFSEFRALQEEAVRTALDGRDVLVVMPTGAGKSLCFQMPAALTEGVTIVVSPLVALMRDQVGALQERTAFGHLGAASLNSLQNPNEQSAILEDVTRGNLRLLYVAPERFRSQAFLDALRGIRPARFVVDEAHCISEWGHDFRPDYLRLKEVVQALGHPPLMAVTATATRRVQESIVRNLGMREPEILVGGFNRPNLHFSVKKCKNDAERETMLFRALPKLAQMGGSGLIYAPTRKLCERLGEVAARALASQNLRAGVYHAGLEPSIRNAMQEHWLRGEIHTLVATNAFGMGIDKPDVRFVLHAGYPDSPESYYQEAGRAGRDGRKSRCVILSMYADRRLREFLIDNDALDAGDVKNAFLALAQETENGIATIPRGWWKTRFDWNDTKARLALSELERRNLIERLVDRAETQSFRVVGRDFPAETFRLVAQDLKAQREERFRRLEEVIAYCRTGQCRRRLMLDYFGDTEEIDHSFCCDNCDNPPLQKIAPARPTSRERVADPSDFDRSNLHHILQAMDALWPTVGKGKLNQLLRGANSKGLEKFRTNACPLFGALRGSSVDTVDRFLEKLFEQGLLHQADEEEYFVCTITSAGREAWQLQSDLDIVLPGQPRVAPSRSRAASTHETSAESSPESDKIYEKLVAWRRTQSFAENVPPYCVLGNRTLQEIAQMAPRDDVELRTITGIGESKLRRYGAAILGVLKGVSAPVSANVPEIEAADMTPVEHLKTVVVSPVIAPAIAKASAGIASSSEKISTEDIPASETVADTYLLLQDGMSIEEIARARRIKASTVWGHLETLIRDGLLESEALEILIPASLRSQVEQALDKANGAGLRPAWDALGGVVDYGLIRCVAAARGIAE